MSVIAPLPTDGVIYHYTDQKGLLGIIGDGSKSNGEAIDATVRATSIRHMNDSLEYEYAFRLAKQVFRRSARSYPRETRESMFSSLSTLGVAEDAASRGPVKIGDRRRDPYKVARVPQNIKLAKAIIDAFVVSFSENDDDLSLWRAYCPDRVGFCIGFNAKRLKELAEQQDFRLDFCRYKRREHTSMIKTILEEGVRPTTDEKDLQTRNTLLVWKFVQAASVIKHSSFQHEREWRLLSMRSMFDSSTHPIFYREGKSFTIPYRKFNLGEHDANSPIVTVRVGPSPHKKLAVNTIQDYVVQMGLSHVSVKPSRTPYRL